MSQYDPSASAERYDANSPATPSTPSKARDATAPTLPQFPPGLSGAIQVYAAKVMEARMLEAQLDIKYAEYLAVITREAELDRLKTSSGATVSAWCVDYTEDLTGTVATMEVPGEVNPIIGGGINIRPGYFDRAAWNGAYGQLQHSTTLSPAGFAWNFTMIQPWVKWMPLWRYGTVTGKNEGADTADVNLHPILSKAGPWLAKQADFNEPWQGSMSAVPVQYMNCGAKAFDVGDEVVVEFRYREDGGLGYYEPFVIGFKDHPKVCYEWPDALNVFIGRLESGWTTIGGSYPIFVAVNPVGGDLYYTQFANSPAAVRNHEIYCQILSRSGGTGATFSFALEKTVLWEGQSYFLLSPTRYWNPDNPYNLTLRVGSAAEFSIKRTTYPPNGPITLYARDGFGEAYAPRTGYLFAGATNFYPEESVESYDLLLTSAEAVKDWALANGAPGTVLCTATFPSGQTATRSYALSYAWYEGQWILTYV